MAMMIASRGSVGMSRPQCHPDRTIAPRRCTVQCQASKADTESQLFKGSVQGRRAVLGAGIATALVRVPVALATDPKTLFTRQGEVRHTDEEWKSILSPSAYRILRQEGTELPFSSPLNNEKREGVFKCAGCGSPVFVNTTKFNSGTGWPSFYQALPGTTDELPDLSIPFLPRTEVRCHVCQGHLGHVFDDGPRPTGLRYCMNGAALTFEPKAI